MITGPLGRRLLAQQPRVLSQRPVARVISRPLSYTCQLQARKDAQSKDSLKPEPNEYSKSGSDDEAARVEKTAFDPNKTSPEEQHDSAESESAQLGQASNPLNVSPANQEVSQPRGSTEGGHEGSAASSSDSASDRSRSSGSGSPTKGSKGQKYSS
ncbi:hypothetical protein QM012_001078 [Aureobasidium pullulans]|uniref:Uncharacterized protein n=1 Tax=Aureobasidium pullulans TaxID=5580 RepID=A0ABR0TFL9_AURPU